MVVSANLIKELREQTSCGVIDCKKALEEAGGDLEKAKKILHKKGLEIAQKKAGRVALQGKIEAYVHHGSKIGVLVEVNCESDFVARNEDFSRFVRDVAMQIAATDPKYLKPEDIPAEVLKKVVSKEDFIKSHCLLGQPFIKDPAMLIKDYLTSLVAKIGENIVIRRFVRFKLGEE
ncbi:MAG: translation elongation factor Ts [Candidatus Omnitrophota bacterium]